MEVNWKFFDGIASRTNFIDEKNSSVKSGKIYLFKYFSFLTDKINDQRKFLAD